LLVRFTFCAALLLVVQNAFALTSSDYAVQVSATVQVSPPIVTLSWPAPSDATSYTVSRKLVSDTSWPAGTSVGANTTYTDTSVTAGSRYEYRVTKTGTSATGYGYIAVSIQAPLVDTRGKVILLVDTTTAADMPAELTRLQKDLLGDGWTVIRHDVARTETVPNVKTIIKSDYQADTTNVKALFLFGHIPVPYSGQLAPDGHGDHVGAWPADVYYADMTGNWTDTSVNTTAPSRDENKNIPGDGKFDQSSIPGTVNLQMGRVDLYNMPAFAPKTEKDLLIQYLNKDHDFRHKVVTAQFRGLIDDNFGEFNGEAFAASGFRNFAPFFGAANVKELDYFTELPSNSYMWAYGCGGGWLQGATGVGATSNFASTNTQAIFTMLFGSWFGDWDSTDNFLRAPLANAGPSLTCSWAGRPHWFYHHMAIGETIGYSAKVSQENSFLYQNPGLSARGVHVALMGDPTLRMHVVAPPSGLTAVQGTGVALNWSASSDTVVGYHIYRADLSTGPFTRLTSNPVAATTYTDTSALSNPYTYMIRAVKLESTPSGSYYNASQGIFAAVQPPPTTAPSAPTNLAATAGSAFKITLAWTDNSNNEAQFKIERRSGGGSFTQIATVGSDTTSYSDTSVSSGTQYFYRVRASNVIGDSAYSNEANATTNVSVGAGNGTGLTGDYYDNMDFTALVLTRTDATVNFDFGTGSPDATVGADTFSVRWRGKVQPRFSETYSFFTTADDGVRLWVNGVQLVDNWVDQGPTEKSGTIALTAGQKYDIVMEYYENGGGATARLAWSSASETKAIIPKSQLYPLGSPVTPNVPTGLNASVQSDTSIALSWTDTSSDETGFKIERKIGSGGTYAQIGTVAAGVTSFADSGLSANTTYYYQIRAYSGAGDSAYSNETNAKTSGPNSSPALTSGASASPTTVAAGQSVTFSVGASDSDGDPLTVTWDFGDGSAPSNSGTHVYTTAGTYTATATVSDGKGGTLTSSTTVTVTASGGGGGANGGVDTDGDGVSDSNELLDGTDPLSAASFNKTPMTVTKAKGSAHYGSSGRDSCSISGVVPGLPAFFDPKGASVTIDAGGAKRVFTLDAKGRAHTSDGAFQLKLKFTRNKTTKKSEFLGGNAPFKATLTKGTWTSTWADEGVDPAMNGKKMPLTLSVDLTFGGRVYEAVLGTNFNSAAGKTGTFTLPVVKVAK
jgi:hypothetical protein